MRPWAPSRPALLVLSLAACGAPSEPKAPAAAAATVTVTETDAATAAHPTSARPSGRPAARRDPHVGPHGETAALLGRRIRIVRPSSGEQIIEPSELHPPSGDPSLYGIHATALLFLDDGTLLAGVGDGTVTALDGAGRRRYALGFRGAIAGLSPAGEGLVAVTTQSGVIALMTGDGRLRWERQITGDPLGPAIVARNGLLLTAGPRGVFAVSPAGELVFSHAATLAYRCCDQKDVPGLSLDGDDVVAYGMRFRLDGPHPAVPSREPTFPLTYRKVVDGKVVSLLATGSKELLLLVKGPKDRVEVVRVEEGRTTRFPVPGRAARTEMYIDMEKPARGWFWTDALVAGPQGDPWILARRFHVSETEWDFRMGPLAGAGQILELRGGAIRERNDLFSAFFKHSVMTGHPLAAAPAGQARLFCFGDDKPACAAYDGPGFHLLAPPGRVESVSRIGGGDWLVTGEGKVFRRHDKELVPVSQPDETAFKAVAGTSDRDVWGATYAATFVLHHDGARWTEVPVPAPIESFVVRAADDVWSGDGQVHWDGRRWSLVVGVPGATAMVARDRGDVWLGGRDGLWHGTAPGLSPVRLPPAPPDEGAIAVPPPLPLGAPDTGYVVERARIAVAGSEPLAAAMGVSASPDGVLWVQAWDRLVEVEGAGQGRVLRRGIRESFGRWAYPEAKGRGIVLSRDAFGQINARDEIRRLDGPRTTRDEVQLDGHDVVAVHGDVRGSTWVAGAFTMEAPGWDNLSAHALVRAPGAGFRPVLGLPSATFCDVAATPDGGAWFAGALSPGPAGEGILFRARGRLGSEATARYRAPATLFSVAAVGPEEAWAVGAAGTVIHVRGGAVTRVALAGGAWLRAVYGSGPGDVWIGGDGGTLIHYDGNAFRPVNHPLGGRAAITGIAGAQGAVWAVGPSGILRIGRRP